MNIWSLNYKSFQKITVNTLWNVELFMQITCTMQQYYTFAFSVHKGNKFKREKESEVNMEEIRGSRNNKQIGLDTGSFSTSQKIARPLKPPKRLCWESWDRHGQKPCQMRASVRTPSRYDGAKSWLDPTHCYFWQQHAHTLLLWVVHIIFLNNRRQKWHILDHNIL